MTKIGIAKTKLKKSQQIIKYKYSNLARKKMNRTREREHNVALQHIKYYSKFGFQNCKNIHLFSDKKLYYICLIHDTLR
jgi:hypothetical protein